MDKVRQLTRPTHILLVMLCVMLMQSANLGKAITTPGSKVQTLSEILYGNETPNVKDLNPTTESGSNYHDKIDKLEDGSNSKESTDDRASSTSKAITTPSSNVQASSEIPSTDSEGSNGKDSTTGKQASSTINPTIENETFSQQSGRTNGQDSSSTVTFANVSSYQNVIDEIVDNVKSDLNSSSGSEFFAAETTREHRPAIKGDDKINIPVFGESHSERKINIGEINHGLKTDIKQRPWSVIMAVTKYRIVDGDRSKTIDVNLSQFCTGSLVGERYVLTAAHCVDFIYDHTMVNGSSIPFYRRPAVLKIFVGKSSVNASSTGGITLIPKENDNLFYHPDYTKYLDIDDPEEEEVEYCSKTLWMPDIAILELDRSALELPAGNDVAKVIPLPQGPELANDYFYGRKCFATGAGFTEKGKNGVLYDANMTLEDPMANSSEWENNPDALIIKECLKKQIWYEVGENASHVNHGDSGGPLACPGESGRLVQAGVAHKVYSIGPKVMFTSHFRIGPYVSWIKSVIGYDPAFKKANTGLVTMDEPHTNVGSRPALGFTALAPAVLFLLAVETL